MLSATTATPTGSTSRAERTTGGPCTSSMPPSGRRYCRMTNNPADNQPTPAPDPVSQPPPKTIARSKWERISLAVQLTLSAAVVGGILAFLLLSGASSHSPDDDKRPTRPEEVVQVAGPRSIRIRAG